MPETVFAGRLLAGERVVWAGEPKQGLLFTPRDGFLVPFSLLWCGFAVFWTVGATGNQAPGFVTIWGLMFVVVGLYFVAGRFAVDAWLRRSLRYAVTNQRILIARPAPFSRFTAISLGQLPNIDLSEGVSGRGTIRFGSAAPMWGGRGMTSWTPSLDPTPQFLAIAGARRVFDLIQQASPRP